MPNGTIHTKPGVRNLTYFPNLSTSPRLVGRTVRKEVGNTIKKRIKAITDRAIIQPISNLLFISPYLEYTVMLLVYAPNSFLCGNPPPVSPSLDKGGGIIFLKRGFAPLKLPLLISHRYSLKRFSR
jgi:hypothetical protein